MNRRYFLESCAAFGVVGAMSQSLLGCVIAQNKGRTRADDAAPKKIMKSDEEWKGILSPEQYYITRQAGTEEPYSSSLLNVHESGTFECVCCDLPLFSSKTKFDSTPAGRASGPQSSNETSWKALTRVSLKLAQK